MFRILHCYVEHLPIPNDGGINKKQFSSSKITNIVTDYWSYHSDLRWTTCSGLGVDAQVHIKSTRNI